MKKVIKIIIVFAPLLLVICVLLINIRTEKMLIATFSGKHVSAEFIAPDDGERFIVIRSSDISPDRAMPVTGTIRVFQDNVLIVTREITEIRSFGYHPPLPVYLIVCTPDEEHTRGFVFWNKVFSSGEKYRIEVDFVHSFSNAALYITFQTWTFMGISLSSHREGVSSLRAE